MEDIFLRITNYYLLSVTNCILILISLTVVPIQGDLQSVQLPVWERVYEYPYLDMPNQLIATPDGGYILAGFQIVEEMDQTSWILKVDSDGVEEWNQNYINPTKPFGNLRSIISTPDGNFVGAGKCYLNDQSTWDAWIIKIDENGNEEWNQTFAGKENGPDYASQILNTVDGGFLILGATQSEYALDTEEWDTDYWLIKTDSVGNEEWNKTFHRKGSDQGTGLIVLNDGKYLLSGLSKQSADINSPFSIWVLKISDNGTVIWNNHYEHGVAWYGAWERNLVAAADGGFLLTCYPFGDSHIVGENYWILKCDSEGMIEWDTTFESPNYDTPTVCLQSSSGDYYIGGSFNSLDGNLEGGDMCIVRLNNSGSIQGYITYGDGRYGERIVDMILIEESDSSESIIALGFVANLALSEDIDFWLGKFKDVNKIENGNLTTSDTIEFSALISILLGLIICLRCKRWQK